MDQSGNIFSHQRMQNIEKSLVGEKIKDSIIKK